eukprot:CAMPEP_0172678998 /NCGR_PEP_ID=MMETSP1074-20121228/15765_1 /TAXON_ID=2916 /ORGANISM="Ceratium fusus, Strain PA161109" /LENGTH=756 /DNA_ID=CAMNT_0013497107 /DNA_START=161 /DNA_END=2428 /DNA_ORIENTATION=-
MYITQGSLFVGVLLYCFTYRVWLGSSDALGWIVEFNVGKNAHDFSGVGNHTSNHCDKPWDYWYNSSTGRFKPQGCEQLPPWDAVRLEDGGAFVTTHVRERLSWEQVTGPCTTNVREQCALIQGSNMTTNRSCACTLDRDFFTLKPEGQQLIFFHSFHVDAGAHSMSSRIRGVNHESHRMKEAARGIVHLEGKTLTMFLKTDGTACAVGGRSEWDHVGAQHGIAGTLGEWLACAGISLDDRPRDFAPHFRTWGVTLQLALNYRNHHLNDDVHDVLCRVTVEAQTRRTAAPVMHDLVQVPQVDGVLKTERLRQVHGVLLSTRVSGDYREFNAYATISTLLELFVLFQVPPFIIRLVALHCLGALSQVYRHARSTRLNIYSHFHCGIARMLLAEIGFHGLLGSSRQEGLTGQGCLSEEHIVAHMQDIFHEQVKKGVLAADELERIGCVVFRHLQRGSNSSGVSCGDFIHACTFEDTLDSELMIRVLRQFERAGRVQRSLMPNVEKLRSSISYSRDSKSSLDSSFQSCIDKVDVDGAETQNVAEESPRDVSSVTPPRLQPLDAKSVDANALGATHLVDGEAKVAESPRPPLSREALVWMDGEITRRLMEHEQRMSRRLDDVVRCMTVLEAEFKLQRCRQLIVANEESQFHEAVDSGGTQEQAEADGPSLESMWSAARRSDSLAAMKPVTHVSRHNEASPQRRGSLRQVMVDVDALNVEVLLRGLKEEQVQLPSTSNAQSKGALSGRLQDICSSGSSSSNG